MKPWIKKMVVGATVLTASVGLSACTSKKDNKKPYEIDYSFTNYEDTYTVNQPFSIVGTVLKITMSDGTTKDVEITESMIKTAPDMSKLGEQTVVIEYEGNKYEFKITVSQHVDEGLVSKLKDFLNKYESNKDSSIDIQIKPNVVAKYLQDSATVDESTSMKLLSTMFDEDMLTDALYNAVFDGVVEGSFNLDRDFIIDSEALKAKLDTVKVLESLKKSGMEFNFKKYAVQKALPDENSDEVQSLISEVCNIFEIDSVSGMIAMQEIILNNYNKIRNLEDVDAVIFISEILECAKIYSSNSFIKDTCANIQSLNSENIIHFISTMKKTEWLNNGKVVTKEVFTNWFYNEERPSGISSTEVANLIKKRAYAEENRLAAYENALVALTNVSNVKDVELLVADFLAAHAEYASEMVVIHQGLENKKYTMILDDGNNVEFFGNLTFETVNQKPVCYTDYDSEIEDFSAMAAELESFAHNIKTYGFLQTIKNKEIVENIFASFSGYPEENKADAVKKIYAILNQELYGDELYWAIADIMFPTGNFEHYEQIKSIVKTSLEEGVNVAIKENQLVEAFFNVYLDSFPEEDKDKAIQNIYSIIEGEKQNQDLYSAIMEIVVPNSLRAEQINKLADYICDKTYITLKQGRTAMQTVVGNYYSDLLAGEQIDFVLMAQEIVDTIKQNTDNEKIRKTITAMKSESVAQTLEALEIVEILFDTYLTQYPEANKQQAIDLIYSIMKGEKQDKELISSLIDIVLPQETRDHYLDHASNYICDVAGIESEGGKNVIKEIINKYINQIINFEKIDVKAAFEELGIAINTHTTNDYVKQATTDLNTQDINQVIHMISNIARIQMSEEYVIVDKFNCSKVDFTTINTPEAQQILDSWIDLHVDTIAKIEDEILSLINEISVENALTFVRNCMDHEKQYHEGGIAFWESMRDSDLVLGYYSSYEDEYGFYHEIVCSVGEGFWYGSDELTIDVDRTMKFYGYEEQINKINGLSQYVDLIADLYNDPYEALRQVLDVVLDESSYPQVGKQQAIDTLISIAKGDKKGEELYLAIMDVLTPKDDEYHIDYVTNMICWLATIDSSDGETEIRNIISTYYNKLITAEQFDVKVALEELSDALYTYSSNDYVKQATADLNTQDINEVIHLISNIARIQMSKEYVIVDKFDCHKVDFTIVNTPEAQQILNSWINLHVDTIIKIENEILSLAKGFSINGLFDLQRNSMNHLIDYNKNAIEFWNSMRDSDLVLGIHVYDYEMYDYPGEQHVVSFVGRGVIYNGEAIVDIDNTIANYSEKLDPYQMVVDYIDLASKFYNDPYQTLSDLLDENKNEWIGDLLNQLGYPEENKQQAIDTLVAILKGEKQGKDLYLAIADIVAPNKGEVYIESVSNFLSTLGVVETAEGKASIKQIVKTNLEKVLAAEKVDAEALILDLISAIEEHTSSEYIKVYAKNIDTSNLKHFLSDMVYADYKHHNTVIELGENGEYRNKPTSNAPKAQEILNRYLNNVKTVVYNLENEIFSLSSTESVVDILDVAHSVVDSISKFYAEEVAILEDLSKTNYMIIQKEYFDEIPGYAVDEDPSLVKDFYPYVIYLYKYEGYVETIEYKFDETIADLQQAKCAYNDILGIIDNVRLFVSDPQTMIEDLIAEYKEEAVGTILNMCYEMLEIDPSSEFAQEVTNFAVDCVDSYIAGNFNKQEALKTIDNIIETYASPETKTVLKASFMLYNAINYDEDIDYNEIFKDIELPEEIKDVDFNVLIKKILDSDTYDIFTFSDVEIEYITNDNDEIVAEKLTLKVDVDFDVMISSMKGDVEITMILDLDGQI